MDATIAPYSGERWEPIATLINEAYSERWSLPRLVITGQEWEPVTAEGLEEEVHHGRLPREGLFVATEGERVLSLAWGRIAGEDQERVLELVYLATRRERRRQGLATACLQALADWGRSQGADRVRVGEVDSRLRAVCGYLEAQGFACREPENLPITMEADASAYQPLPLELPPGYRLVTFRPGEDEAPWADLRNEIFGEPLWTPEQFIERFESKPYFDPQGWVFVENEAGKKVAFSGIVIARDESGRVTGAQIEWVGALPECRGLKLGQAVVVACLNYVAQFEPGLLILVTQYFRGPAIGLYEKLGFRMAKEWRVYEKEL
jgi:mycothiol synthase